jgi:hypothetical protein
MGQNKGRKKLFTALAIIGALLLIVVAFWMLNNKPDDTSSDAANTTDKDSPAISEEANKTDEPVKSTPVETSTEPAIDPATVSTVAIEPMTVNVTYLKGVGGFDYEVLRTPSGTKYVQFSSSKLVGTKCTDDEGAFASIIDTPAANESATVAKTVTVDGTTYGLSLVDATCTSDAELLKQYQNAFSEPFHLLKKM